MSIEGLDKQKLFNGYLNTLTKAWEIYMKIVDLSIALSGATALVFINSIKQTDWNMLANKGLIIYVFLFSGLSLFSGILWRLASQYFMEYETIGSPQIAKLYFEITGVDPVTTVSRKTKGRLFYGFCFKFFPLPTGLFLLVSWGFIFKVLFG
ncbi:MAG: hypothetical protein MUC65_07960 [Pontiellaceae bacterium]|jgi:hypothetical protein|nr:hypothetical protein [Pontiellaceae bacterium]